MFYTIELIVCGVRAHTVERSGSLACAIALAERIAAEHNSPFVRVVEQIEESEEVVLWDSRPDISW